MKKSFIGLLIATLAISSTGFALTTNREVSKTFSQEEIETLSQCPNGCTGTVIYNSKTRMFRCTVCGAMWYKGSGDDIIIINPGT